jgi:hypothetical protein
MEHHDIINHLDNLIGSIAQIDDVANLNAIAMLGSNLKHGLINVDKLHTIDFSQLIEGLALSMSTNANQRQNGTYCQLFHNPFHTILSFFVNE